VCWLKKQQTIEALEENQIDKFRLESVKKFASMEKISGEESEFE
jgi:hypothetical protein